MKIPPKHKEFMDQIIETYQKSFEEFFSDDSNRGPKYDPAKMPGHIAELVIATTSLTLDDEWDPKYEEYIKEKANVLN